MKKQYLVPQTDFVLSPAEAVLLTVSEAGSVPGVDGDAPARKEFTPSFDHGNLV